MSMPRFTADLCLRNTDQRYQVSALEHRTDQTIQPALMGPNAPGIADCLQDCMDAHPDWTVARCKASYRDSGVSQGGGGGLHRDFASKALCWYGYLLCDQAQGDILLASKCFLPAWLGGGGPCSCAEVRDQCLAS